jgi:hypothetical protein
MTVEGVPWDRKQQSAVSRCCTRPGVALLYTPHQYGGSSPTVGRESFDLQALPCAPPWLGAASSQAVLNNDRFILNLNANRLTI